MTVKPGETLSGHISTARNEKNPRDLDIKIKFNYEGEISKLDVEQVYRLR